MLRSGKKRFMAALLQHVMDNFWFGGLEGMLVQHMLMDTNQYPCSKETINILNTSNKTARMQPCIKLNKNGYYSQTDVAFAQDTKGNTADWDMSKVTCYHSNECPKKVITCMQCLPMMMRRTMSIRSMIQAQVIFFTSPNSTI